MKNYSSERNPLGTIRYNEDVIKTMINMALSRIDGVDGIEGRGSGSLLSRKAGSHVQKITMEGQKVVIELSIAVEYGLPLQEKAREVQLMVRETIETMTDLQVESVHVTVAGLIFND